MKTKYCKVLSGIVMLMAMLICAPTASAYWKKYATYEVFHAEGPSTGKNIVCYSDCVPETDNCAYKYVFGGITLYEKYRYDMLEEYSDLSTTKLNRVKRIFNSVSPGSFNNEDDIPSYAVSKDGKYELFVCWGMGIPNAWLYKNGKFDSALWFSER